MLGLFPALKSFPGQGAASAGFSRYLSLLKSCLDHYHLASLQFEQLGFDEPKLSLNKPERHPLPPRPPVEVCLNDSLPQEINSQHQPAVEDQTSCVNPGVEASDFEDIRQLQVLPSSGDEDHPMIYDNLGPESKHPLGFESGDPGLACTTSQQSHTGFTRSYVLNSECCHAAR